MFDGEIVRRDQMSLLLSLRVTFRLRQGLWLNEYN
jgi:hypothetical protein